MKSGSVHEFDEINDSYLYELLHNHNDLQGLHYNPSAFLLHKKDLAMQTTSNDKNGKIITLQDLKNFNSQSLAT